MELRSTRALGTQLIWIDHSESTNLTLRQMWETDHELPAETLVITDQQTRGRGRLGRGWETPKGKALAISTLVRGFQGLGPSWLPLIAGSAVVRALEPFFPAGSHQTAPRAVVKWPNDVHLRVDGQKLGKKLNGILCELLPDGSAIIGVGANLFQDSHELPTARAGSLFTEGAVFHGQLLEPGTLLDEPVGAQLADEFLARYVTELRALVTLAGSDAEHVREIVAKDSATIGTHVRVLLPDGNNVTGKAIRFDPDGALVVQHQSGELFIVHSGDVEHVREE